MKLLRVGIANYRSIGEDFIFLDLTRKINLLIGANNCGKSNVLRGLILLNNRHGVFPSLQETDKHQRKADSNLRFHFDFETGAADGKAIEALRTISVECRPLDGHLEVVKSTLDGIGFDELNILMETVTRERFARQPSEEQMRQWRIKVANGLFDNFRPFPQIAIVPQFRQIVEHDKYSLDGRGIVNLLSSWQHPQIGNDKDYEKFCKVEGLLRRLLEMPSAKLEVSHASQILVTNNRLRLPLESYGTGIHELIIIAIAVLSMEKIISCIEEPEIHLHPLLQKRLIDFLRTETENQYVITTHSPALIAPQRDTAVTHLWLEDGVTKSRQVETTEHSLQVLHDLGVQASDLLQANSVIWVEGPSDRIYLNAWLRLTDPTLREDIDYSIMFYGGRLLAHLSMEREQTDDAADLVKLLRVNQHSAIIIDSDKDSEQDEINTTKQRVKKECDGNGVYCWITAGREIENYLPIGAVKMAYQEITGTEPDLKFSKFDRLDERLEEAFGKTNWKAAWSYNKAKPEMARNISKNLKVDNIEEGLKKELDQLVSVIRHKK